MHEIRILRTLLPGLLLTCLLSFGCDTPPVADDGDDVTLDTEALSSSCGHLDQPCCGSKRATSFKSLAKRCKTKNTVCPQSECSDVCEVCGLNGQSCCIVDNKPSCRDGSACLHSVPGGHGKEAGSGVCVK